MSNYCKNCYELTEELENHKRWIKDYKQKLEDAEEFANAKITQCGNLIKQLNETFEQLEAYKMEAEEGKEINAELKAENEILEKINKNNQEKIKKLNEILEEEFIAKQYGDEALFFTLMDIKEIAESVTNTGSLCKICEINKTCADCLDEKMREILEKIKEVIKDEE